MGEYRIQTGTWNVDTLENYIKVVHTNPWIDLSIIVLRAIHLSDDRYYYYYYECYWSQTIETASFKLENHGHKLSTSKMYLNNWSYSVATVYMRYAVIVYSQNNCLFVCSILDSDLFMKFLCGHFSPMGQSARRCFRTFSLDVHIDRDIVISCYEWCSTWRQILCRTWRCAISMVNEERWKNPSWEEKTGGYFIVIIDYYYLHPIRNVSRELTILRLLHS